MTEAFKNWWREHYSMTSLHTGAAWDAWDAATEAERERCAKIADTNVIDDPVSDWSIQYSEACRDIAAAIRV